MKKIAIIVALLIVLVGSVSAQKADDGKNQAATQTDSTEFPPGFKSDGCTLFPDGNYRDCCIAHDVDYYKGGKGRRAADKRLYRCVKKKKGWKNKFIAPMMFLGVRIGGVSFLPTPFRWGFGRKRMRKLEKKVQLEKKTSDTKKKEVVQPTKTNN